MARLDSVLLAVLVFCSTATPQRTKVFKRAEREFIQQFDTYEPRPVNEKCLRCLCSTTCSDINNNNCAEADCLKISRDYWIESGSPEVRWGAPQNDDPYLDCASDFDCSVRSVQGFMHRFQEDCNGDGIIDCDDFVNLHWFGFGLGPGECKNSELPEVYLQHYQWCKNLNL
ncbi:hypothetical protein Zmor_024189 [Zophobas morio]|uniref:lysozyme n=1 Tax=Zophobas morio TaxID=2755281 RepID=A0AA38HZS0_9CUCU|nr:hypothetical protein Zmor_024189 [Zophobas morio]